MQNAKATKSVSKRAEQLSKTTKFSLDEVTALMRIYDTSGRDKMDVVDFKGQIYSLMRLTEEAILDKMFRVFDANSDNFVNADEWINGLSTVLRGDMDDLKAYCFRIYDLDNDGYITKDNIMFLMKDSFVQMEENENTEEHVKQLAELAIKKMDVDKDGRLSFEDFSESVDRDPLLLEAFGPCLPDHHVNLVTGNDASS